MGNRSYTQDLIYTNRPIGATSRCNKFTASTTSKKVPTTALSNRNILLVYNDSTSNVFYGYASSVANSTGMTLSPGEKIQKTLEQGVYLWVISTVAAALRYEEISPD